MSKTRVSPLIICCPCVLSQRDQKLTCILVVTRKCELTVVLRALRPWPTSNLRHAASSRPAEALDIVGNPRQGEARQPIQDSAESVHNSTKSARAVDPKKQKIRGLILTAAASQTATRLVVTHLAIAAGFTGWWEQATDAKVQARPGLIAIGARREKAILPPLQLRTKRSTSTKVISQAVDRWVRSQD